MKILNPKVAFVCELPAEHFLHWQDGLKAALEHLGQKYAWEIDIFNIPSMKTPSIDVEQYNFGLFWGAFSRKQHERRFFKKQGLCFGGGPTYHPNINNFDIVFAESKVDYDEFKRMGVRTVQAFGTNTKLFRPMPEQPKVFDYIYPAAFALWKRHDRFVEEVKKRGGNALAVGYMQPGGWERETYEICQKNGILVLPWIPYSAMPYLMNMTRNVIITADATGGCQRTVLEAKACDVPVIIESDSAKLQELKGLSRKEVLKDWSEVSYAEKLREGIDQVLETNNAG